MRFSDTESDDVKGKIRDILRSGNPVVTYLENRMQARKVMRLPRWGGYKVSAENRDTIQDLKEAALLEVRALLGERILRTPKVLKNDIKGVLVISEFLVYPICKNNCIIWINEI